MARTKLKIITVNKLRVGQRFSWIPAAWYGPCVLKKKVTRKFLAHAFLGKLTWAFKFDLGFKTHIPTATSDNKRTMQRYITWDYGVLGSTKVRLLKRRIKRGH